MKRFLLLATAALPFAAPPAARAHGVAGAHMFVSTLLIDDANVADEASLPTFSALPDPNNQGPAGTTLLTAFELDKRITERFGFAINTGYQWVTRPGDKTANGWNNITVTLKDKVWVNDPHEVMVSLGVQRSFARSGATGANGATLGNDDSGSTAPTLYFAKGLGDLPVPLLRPLAITGELSYSIADKKLKVDPVTGAANNGNANAWSGGLSLQYSLRYLSSQVKDYGLPDFVNRLTPMIEMAWSSPASRPNTMQTTYLFGVGLNYTASGYGFGLEALIPGNRDAGAHIGVIAQFHLYFDDLLPHSLGTPILSWF